MFIEKNISKWELMNFLALFYQSKAQGNNFEKTCLMSEYEAPRSKANRYQGQTRPKRFQIFDCFSLQVEYPVHSTEYMQLLLNRRKRANKFPILIVIQVIYCISHACNIVCNK